MPRIIVLFFILILSLYSCKKKEEKPNIIQTVTKDRSKMIKTDQSITGLNPKAQELTKNWPEYHKFKELITQYQHISMTDALLNSVELSVLSQQLKDSIRVEDLNIPEVKIRLNVLHSQSLRLADMSKIPTITEQEVAMENNNIINAFSALNLKINNMNLRDEINDEISQFIDELTELPEKDSIEKPAPSKIKINRPFSKKK